MADENTQTGAAAAGQTAGQSSSQSSNQSQSGQQTEAQGGAASHTQGSQAQTTKVERPAYVPEQFWDAAASKVKDTEFGQHFNELSAFKAAADSKRLTLPQKPEDYKLDLPKDFKAPEGMTAPTFDESNPLTPQFRAVAQKHGLTQDAASDLLAIYAAGEIKSAQTQKAAFDGEVAKLGATGPVLIDAIKTWLNATGTPSLANTLWTADIVRDYAKLMQKVQTQGGGNFSQAHREQGGGEPSDEAYAKMSFAEKMDYARTHSNGKTT